MDFPFEKSKRGSFDVKWTRARAPTSPLPILIKLFSPHFLPIVAILLECQPGTVSAFGIVSQSIASISVASPSVVSYLTVSCRAASCRTSIVPVCPWLLDL